MSLKLIFFFVFCGVSQSKLINLSCNQIRAFVDGHNSRRLQLAKGEVPGQPAASDMKLMVWDNELATKAAKWASRNQFLHNPDKNIGSGRFKTGENLYSYGTTDSKHKIDIDDSLKSWFNEHQHYTYGPLSMSDFDGSSKYQIGHYTQMVWADTTYMGCAISQNWQANLKEFLIVCNYGPSGNYIGVPPYKTGQNSSNFLKCGTEDCSRPYVINLSCKQVRAFVDGHNSRRLQLAKGQIPGQPPASVMKLMIWDEELATKAAKWASRNQFRHNPEKSIGSRRFNTGENLYWYATTDPNHKLDIDGSLKSWFDEHYYFTHRPLKMKDFDGSSKHQIGHYTQMAWANTMYVGCAISQYWRNNFKEYLVVCNYGPGGNYIGQVPYETKRGASNTLTCDTKDCRQLYGDKC